VRYLTGEKNMEKPLNESCFLEPHWRVIAQGFQTELWFNDGQALGTGGIRNPQPIHLMTGQYYYRFASSNSPREAQLGGEDGGLILRITTRSTCLHSRIVTPFVMLLA
jgi:hypothetical protein